MNKLLGNVIIFIAVPEILRKLGRAVREIGAELNKPVSVDDALGFGMSIQGMTPEELESLAEAIDEEPQKDTSNSPSADQS